MPGRLLKPYQGQPAGQLYWGADVPQLRYLGIVDDNYELATDYQSGERDVTGASVNVVTPAFTYNMNSATAQTINLPIRADLPKGSVLTFVQLGTGAFTLVPASGVTVNKASSLTSLVSKGQYSVAQLIKTGPGEVWVAYGGFGG